MNFAELIESLDRDIKHHQNIQSASSSSSISSPEIAETPTERVSEKPPATKLRQEKHTIPVKINDTLVMISSSTNAFEVLDTKLRVNAFENALFLHLSTKLSRPLRHWEVITQVLESTDGKSFITLEKCSNSLLEPKSLRGKYPKIQGYAHVHLKGRWEKVFLHLAESTLNYYHNGSQLPHLLAHLSDWDVYSIENSVSSSPFPYCFALSSTHPLDYFEKKSEGLKYFCVEKPERVGDWIKALTAARNEKLWIDSPNLFVQFTHLMTEKAKKHKKDLRLLQKKAQGDDADDEKSRSNLALDTKKSGEKKTLIDVSSAQNCRTCGCSSKSGSGTCSNCFHKHF